MDPQIRRRERPPQRRIDPLGRREFLAVAGAAATLPLVRPRHRWFAPNVLGPLGPDAAGPALGREPLDRFIEAQMADAHVPGLAACVVLDGRVVWSAGYGWADIEGRRRVTPDTIFMLASISKTVMATAAMQAVEDGVLSLDADIDQALPFRVRNPNHPWIPITLRQLLTHTSGLRDNWQIFDRFYVEGDSEVPLRGFLRRYLTAGSALYDQHRNFQTWTPGSHYAYSNIGAALAGYLVEASTGVPFDRWCERRIFGPLEMTSASWHLRGLDRGRIAMPYGWNERGFTPYGQYGYPDYPDGELRTSARDLAHHLLSFMEFGSFRGARVLKGSTVREMRRPQHPRIAAGQGLIWYAFHRQGRRLLGHNGGDSGVATQMYFRPDDGVGVIVLANGDWRRSAGRWPLAWISDRLFAEAASLGTRSDAGGRV